MPGSTESHTPKSRVLKSRTPKSRTPKSRTPKSRVPISRSEASFEDYKPAYDELQAVAEANRCLYCEDAPCTTACPTSIVVPEFIRRIATGDVRGSARTIYGNNILGMSCARVCPVEVLCVGACVYHKMGLPPIRIGRLQRFATDTALDKGWRFFEAGPDTGESVGLVGGGPASLAAAHELRRLGHACTIYDRREFLGGLNTHGVAPYKLRSDRADQEVEWLLGIGGIELRKNTRVGAGEDADLTWAELEQKHDAIFIGIGLGDDRLMDVPGEELEGVHGGVDFIERLKLGRVDLSPIRHAVAVGGGNTALDCVRELLGLGVPDVTLIYRGSRAAMPGYQHEWKAALLEGARAIWNANPLAFVGEEGRVTSVHLARTDQAKKPIPGSEFTVPAELVLLGIGQGRLGHLLAEVEGLEVDRGRVVVGPDQATTKKGWFAGGDCANGAKEVVNAAAEGRDAARAIDAYLRGE